MTKKTKVFIASGGTGGHVLPGSNLAKHFSEKNYHIELITDKRGYKYLGDSKDLKIKVLPSSKLITKNILTIFISVFLIIYSVLRSLVFLILNRPSIMIGMGGYASFPICIAASMLRIKLLIYENNLIIGKANSYLAPFSKKILVSNKNLEGILEKYYDKVLPIGNILNKEIINFANLNEDAINLKKLSLIILGGSQAAKVFAEILPEIFKKCSEEGINLKIYQQCLPNQSENLKLFYNNNNIECELFNFSNKIINYFSKVNLAITRSGSSILAELTNVNVPFISVPLPSSAENHQLKNAIFYKKKNLSLLIEEKDLKEKLIHVMRKIYKDNSILNKIKKNQKQYSDKNVYNNIDKILDEIINEKN